MTSSRDKKPIKMILGNITRAIDREDLVSLVDSIGSVRGGTAPYQYRGKTDFSIGKDLRKIEKKRIVDIWI